MERSSQRTGHWRGGRGIRGLQLLGALGVCGALLAIVVPAAFPAGAKTTRVSVSSRGAQANGKSRAQSISADGRFVAFDSFAGNLVGGDTNGSEDVFVHDRRTGKTTRVSVSSKGAEANLNSDTPSISANGRFVAFVSFASNLVGADTNGSHDIFVHNRRTGKTRRVSVTSSGAQARGLSFGPSISANGRFVAFASFASDLVPGDTNGLDVFVHDRRTGKTRRVSVSSSGAQARENSSDPSISADGRFVAFESSASNLVRADTNEHEDLFVRDLRTGKTRRVSVSSSGAQAHGNSFDPSISASGRFVAFASLARNLVSGDTNHDPDIFVRDRRRGKTRLVSVSSAHRQGNDRSRFDPSISADGRFVAFESLASNLVSGDTNHDQDIFVRDRRMGKTTRISVSASGAQADGDSLGPSISAGGRLVAFESFAGNLVSGDTNQRADVFVRGPLR
jgi:Tol biopolymer transport system component